MTPPLMSLWFRLQIRKNLLSSGPVYFYFSWNTPKEFNGGHTNAVWWHWQPTNRYPSGCAWDGCVIFLISWYTLIIRYYLNSESLHIPMLLKLQDAGEQPCKKYEVRFRKLMGIQSLRICLSKINYYHCLLLMIDKIAGCVSHDLL